MQRQHSTLFLLSQNSTEMAVKIALLAALCFAQAFAFPFIGLGDEAARGMTDRDLQIVKGCFQKMRVNFVTLEEKIAMVPEIILEDVDEEIRESVQEALKRVEQPVTKMGVVITDIFSNMAVNINRLDILKAYEALIEGARAIDGLVDGIRMDLNQVKVEKPELTSAIDLYMRTLIYQIKVMIPKIRRDYGECLVIGRPSAWE